MEQRSHKFKAESFDAAYRQMVEALGKDAIVVNTAEVTEGGILGFLGQRMIELTAQVKPAPRPPCRVPAALPRRSTSFTAESVRTSTSMRRFLISGNWHRRSLL